MVTLQQLNLICGIGWDEGYNDKVFIVFHEQDGGLSEEITFGCNEWHLRITLDKPFRTAHLPQVMHFKIQDLRAIYRKLKLGYKNYYVILPLEFSQAGFEVVNGPSRGSKVQACRGF
jgi:hypothetical protein